MSPWLILTPALVWLIALAAGATLLRRPAESLWRGLQPARAEPVPFDPANRAHRFMIGLVRLQGWFLVAVAALFTLMSILVAAGIVPAARS